MPIVEGAEIEYAAMQNRGRGARAWRMSEATVVTRSHGRGHLSRAARPGGRAATLLAALAFAALSAAPMPAVAEASKSAEAAIRARIVYLAAVQDVAWFEVSGSELHIGFRSPVIDNIAILNGAVAMAVAVTGAEVEIRGYGYDASRWPYRSRGAGAECIAVGKSRVEETRCLVEGAWVSVDPS